MENLGLSYKENKIMQTFLSLQQRAARHSTHMPSTPALSTFLRRGTLFFLTASFSLASAAAFAVPIHLNTRGIISTGIDELGLFGEKGADLAGLAFSQTLYTDSDDFAVWAEGPGYKGWTSNFSNTKTGAKVKGKVTIKGVSYSWEVDHSEGYLILSNIVTQLSGPRGANGGTDQMLAFFYGERNQNNYDGIHIIAGAAIGSGEKPFVDSLALTQKSSAPVAVAGPQSNLFFQGYKDNATTSIWVGNLTQFAWNVQQPATPQIAAIESWANVSGDAVKVTWNKWWGVSGNRWELFQNGSLVCQDQLALSDPANDNMQAQSASCVAHLGEGENVFTARLCYLDICSDSAPYSVALTSPSVDNNAPTWESNGIYRQGDQVVYQGRTFVAKHWVQSGVPGVHPAWRLLANANTAQVQTLMRDWKNGAQAAYSIVFDDYCAWANDAGLIVAESELSKRGLVAGFGVIAGACGDAAWSPHWPNLKSFVQRGHELINHSWDHGHPLDADWAAKKWAGNSLEIIQSSKTVAEQVAGYQMQFYGFPFDVASDAQMDFLKNRPQYLGTRKPNYWQANGINEKNFADPFGVRFQVYAQADQGADNPASLSNFLQTALHQQGWGMRVFHSVADNYYESVPLADFQQHLDQVQSLSNSGQLWLANASDVLKYRFTREYCPLKPAQTVAQGTLLSFDNASAGCRKYATPITLEFSNASRPLEVLQAGKALPLTTVAAGVYRVSVDPLAGNVLLK